MVALIPPALTLPLALLLAGVAIGTSALSLQRFGKAYRLAGHYGSAVWFVRGMRCLIMALTMSAASITVRDREQPSEVLRGIQDYLATGVRWFIHQAPADAQRAVGPENKSAHQSGPQDTDDLDDRRRVFSRL